MVYVAVARFESPDVFDQLSGVSEACLPERGGMVSVSRLEVGFGFVCFRS